MLPRWSQEDSYISSGPESSIPNEPAPEGSELLLPHSCLALPLTHRSSPVPSDRGKRWETRALSTSRGAQPQDVFSAVRA